MKAIEILSESTITEAPVGVLGQIGRRLGAGALSAIGMKNAAANLGGKADMGARANQYYTAFRKYLGQTGKDEQTATYADLTGFLKKSNLNPAYFKGQQGIIDPNVVNQGFVKMAQDYYSGEQPPGDRNKSAGGSATTGQNAAQTPGSTATGTPTQPSSSGGVTGQSATQPFSVPALVQVIPQMNKRDLNKIKTAVDAALQGKQVVSKTKVNTTGMTQAQAQAVNKAATAQNVNTPVAGRIEPTLGKVSKSTPKKTVAI